MGNYFIKIDASPDVRRKILESSKASIHVLQDYQQILITRSKKLALMQQLRQQLREITMLVNKAESLMPVLSEHDLIEVKPKIASPKAEPPKAAPKGKWVMKGKKRVFVPEKVEPQKIEAPKEVPKQPTEAERLEQTLSKIDSKLNRI